MTTRPSICFRRFSAWSPAACIWYFLRQYKKGTVIEYGKLEFQEEQREAAAGRTAPAELPA